MNNCSFSLLKNLEKDVSELLLKKLEHLDISPQRASQIAKFVLTKLPENLTDEQTMQIIPSLDDEFYELSEVVNKYIVEYENETKPNVSNEVNKLAREGHFEEAEKLMQGYLAKITNVKVAQPV